MSDANQHHIKKPVIVDQDGLVTLACSLTATQRDLAASQLREVKLRHMLANLLNVMGPMAVSGDVATKQAAIVALSIGRDLKEME